MAVTLEQVEKLREKAVGLTYEEAKALLEQTDGDLLDALILLERQGRTAPGGGYFTTRPGGEEGDRPEAPPHAEYWRRVHGDPKNPHGRHVWAFECKDWRGWLRELWSAFVNILRHSTENQFEVWRKGQMMTSIPLLILVILLIVAFWISIPLLLGGLIFGCRYRFSGPDLGKDSINEVIGSVSKTVDDVVDQVKKGFQGKK